jgi:hypothetical protein
MPAAVPTVFAAAVCCAGCTGSKSAAPDPADAGDSGGLYPSQLPADFHCEPTLASIRESIFLTSCGWDSCHGENNQSMGLKLVANVDQLSNELVGAAAVGCSTWTRVVPGDLEHSYLWNKVTKHPPVCGDRMPWGVVPLPPPALDCIQQWIQGL